MAENWLGLDESDIDSAVDANDSREFSEIEPGVYDVNIDAVYLIDKGPDASTMMYLDVSTKDGGSLKHGAWFASAKSGTKLNGFKDKNTGKLIPSPGVIFIKQLFDVLDMNIAEHKPESTKINHYGDEVDAKIIVGFTNKKIKIGVQGEITMDDDGNVYEKNIIIKVMNPAGEYKGENILQKITDRISKKPVVDKTKGKAAKATNNSSDSGSEENDGWA